MRFCVSRPLPWNAYHENSSGMLVHGLSSLPLWRHGVRVPVTYVGDCVGEFGYVNKRGIDDEIEHVSTSCGGNVPCRLISWDYEELDAHVKSRPDARRALEHFFAKKLLEKLEHMNEMHVHDQQLLHPGGEGRISRWRRSLLG